VKATNQTVVKRQNGWGVDNMGVKTRGQAGCVSSERSNKTHNGGQKHRHRHKKTKEGKREEKERDAEKGENRERRRIGGTEREGKKEQAGKGRSRGSEAFFLLKMLRYIIKQYPLVYGSLEQKGLLIEESFFCFYPLF